MPGGDRTGPMGMGQMTGRGMGYCSGFGAQSLGRRGRRSGVRSFGRGLGMGFGFGPAWGEPARMQYYASNNLPPEQPMTKEQETVILRQQAEELVRTLGEINARIEALEKKGSAT